MKNERLKKVLKPLRNVRIINFFRRVYCATTYYNKKYPQILKWGLASREDTNYNYDLTEENILYLSHTIAFITKRNFREIIAYINEARNDSDLKNHVSKMTQKSKYKNYADLQCAYGRRLGWYAFLRVLKPKIIIETGVDKGLGAVLLCSGLLRNKEEGFPGQYFGTDIDSDAGYLLSGKYAEVGRIIYGDSIASLQKFGQPIDMFINDSDHSFDYEYGEYVAIKRLLSKDAIILGDNSHCTDKLAVFSGENDRNFIFFKEVPKDHWCPGAGIGISF